MTRFLWLYRISIFIRYEEKDSVCLWYKCPFIDNNLVRDSKGNNYVYDSHGSVTSILNDNGSKSKDYEYDAFGNIENETNASTYNPWQYCGEYTDPESGLIYLRNRYYDSETGRFINEDPARSGGNWYSYCSGNPVMFWDKMGLKKTMSKSERDQIRKYQDEYNKAKENNDYVGMNKAHLAATNIRKACDPNYKDNYDYTHGGKIYNYTYSTYEVNGNGENEKVTGSVYILNLKDKSKDERIAIANNQSIGSNDYVVIDNEDNANENGPDPSLQVRDSYRASTQVIIAVIDVLFEYKKAHMTIWDRTRGSLINEWMWHNQAYNKNYKRSHTKDVDLNNQDEKNYPRALPFGLK